MPPARFKPAVPASEWPQAHASHGAATGIGILSPDRPSLASRYTGCAIPAHTNMQYDTLITLRSMRGEVHAGFWWGNLKEGDHLEGPKVEGRIIMEPTTCRSVRDLPM